jgi:hypothetical protein
MEKSRPFWRNRQGVGGKLFVPPAINCYFATLTLAKNRYQALQGRKWGHHNCNILKNLTGDLGSACTLCTDKCWKNGKRFCNPDTLFAPLMFHRRNYEHQMPNQVREVMGSGKNLSSSTI